MKYVRSFVMALLTPLLEKNPAKTALVDAPIVFSMSRVIVAVFSVVWIRATWRDGIGGWPEATLAIALVFAIPLLSALDKVKPDVVLEFGKQLLGRFGEGGVRTVSSMGRGDNMYKDDERGEHTRRETVG